MPELHAEADDDEPPANEAVLRASCVHIQVGHNITITINPGSDPRGQSRTRHMLGRRGSQRTLLRRRQISRWKCQQMAEDGAAQAWLEAFVVLRSEGDRADVATWLSEHGFDVVTTTTGVLARGSRQVFEDAFGLTLDDLPTTTARSLPVPAALQGNVGAVTLLPVPEPHES